MSWFSKDKKENNASMLPEIPRQENFILNRGGNFHMDENAEDFPALPLIPKKGDMPQKKDNEDFHNIDDDYSNPPKNINFTRDMNERENFSGTPVYNSISNMDQPAFERNNFKEESNYPRPLRNFEEDTSMTSNDYKIRRPPINNPPQRTMPAPDYINRGNRNSEGNMQKSKMYYEKKKVFTKDTEPIYIRLDRFQTTIESFEEIKSKINEIESLLNKTREIRAKEEKELEEWENEIGIIKSKLDIIDKNIFERVG